LFSILFFFNPTSKKMKIEFLQPGQEGTINPPTALTQRTTPNTHLQTTMASVSASANARSAAAPRPSREEIVRMNSDNQNGVSLCIPRVFKNIGWKRIKQHMIEANLGFVERVDVIPVRGKDFKRAYVHFAPGKWNMRDSTARAALKAMREGKRIHIEYESPWYWQVAISSSLRPAEPWRPAERKVAIKIAPSTPAESKSSQNDNPMNDPIVARAAENRRVHFEDETEEGEIVENDYDRSAQTESVMSGCR